MKGTSSCRLVECCGGVDDGRAAALFRAERKLVGWFGRCLCGAKGSGGVGVGGDRWVSRVGAGVCGGEGWRDRGVGGVGRRRDLVCEV